MMPEAAAATHSAVGKIMRHMLAPLAAGTLLMLLDRAAVGVAARGMGVSLGLDAFQLNLTSTILFLGVLLVEVPSALVADRVGARRWLAAMLAVWGLASVATACATGPAWFFTARVAASAAQAGFLPVAVFALASWTPPGHRTRMVAWITATGILAAGLGAVLSERLLLLDGVAGLPGWRWLFLLVGLPCLPLAVLVLRHLSDRPQTARWLTPAERDALAWLRSVDPHDRPAVPTLAALVDPRLLILAAISFGLALSAVGGSIWFATLLHEQQAAVFSVGTAILAATAATVLIWSRAVDRSGRLLEGLTIACALAAVSYAGSVASGMTVTMLVGLAAHAATTAAARTMLLSATTRLVCIGGGGAAALAVVDATGLVASFVAPRVIAGLAMQAGTLHSGVLPLILVLIATAGLAASLRLFARP